MGNFCKYFLIFTLAFSLFLCFFAGAYFDYSIIRYSDKVYFYDYGDTFEFGQSAFSVFSTFLNIFDSVGEKVMHFFKGTFVSSNYPLNMFSFSPGDLIEVDGVESEIKADCNLIVGIFYDEKMHKYVSDISFEPAIVEYNSTPFSLSSNVEITSHCNCRYWGRPLNRLFGGKTKITIKDDEHTYIFYTGCHFKNRTFIYNAEEFRAVVGE